MMNFQHCDEPRQSEIQQLVLITAAANELLLKQYERYCQCEEFEIEHKSDQSPVTQADLASHQLLTQLITTHFPDHDIISEEQVDVDSFKKSDRLTWLIDPLDGTREFIKKNGEFCVNLALVDTHGDVILAAIGVPTESRVFVCAKGQGVYQYATTNQQWLKYNEDLMPTKTSWVVALSRRKQNDENYQQLIEKLQQHIDIELYHAGSAYKFVLMLESKIDFYPRLHPTYEWDTASGQALLEEIGGCIVDAQGRPFHYLKRDHLLNADFFAFRKSADLASLSWLI